MIKSKHSYCVRFIRSLLCFVTVVTLFINESFLSFADEDIEHTQTGTQTAVKEKSSEVDADILDDIEELIPDDWEEIEISSADDLLVLAYNCSLDTWSRNKYVVLTNDISLENTDFITIPTFGGIFDGQNHKIFNYDIETSQSQIGLFASIQKQGIIKNLRLSGKIIPTGKQSVIGGIAGNNNGLIMNCYFDGLVQSNDYVGGIAGINRLDGIIADCKVSGSITGYHYIGGVTGYNMGDILNSHNYAKVNTTEQDSNVSLEGIDIDSYLQKFSINYSDSNQTGESATKISDITDAGGIAGMSIGVIENCVNDGEVGYEKTGYNIGGIVGRQSGYVYACTNNANILGRKDVGGIVGQAEPYVTIDFTQDIVLQLSENINKLHDVISVTLNDLDGSSDTVSSRLAIIQQFTNSAIQDTDYLASSSVNWVDGMVGTANEIIGRADYIMQETARADGVLSRAMQGTYNIITAGSKIASSLSDLEVYQYMTPEQQLEYQGYQDSLEAINKEYAQYLSTASKAYTNYYLDDIRRSSDYVEKDGTHTNYSSGTVNENNLVAKSSDGIIDINSAYTNIQSELVPTNKQVLIYDNYADINEWIHNSAEGDIQFPDPNEGEQRELDLKLQNSVANCSQDISKDARGCADTIYTQNNQSIYDQDVLNCTINMANILNSDNVRTQMDENVKNDVDETLQYINVAKDEFVSALDHTKNIYNDVLSNGSIELPYLGADYQAHTTSLNCNLQGMSDNFGLLNQELNGSTDTLVADLSAVNDQFNVIMMLYTDAIDGVLDNDYSSTIEDDSLTVAETCTDATISDCKNKGYVYGALDVSGIAGTMAIEYDYDLESDVTGIKDAGLNTTYLTKCVLRNNINQGIIKAEKSYASGICGLQEMGTIFKCENYENIVSVSGEYVGGIAGSSLSDIVQSYSKCILKGKKYIGGIAGSINNAENCIAWVDIIDATDCCGAIAGDITSDGRIRQNYFVSSDLAGVNRISYSMKAEPISYEMLTNIEDMPNEFDKARVIFILDNEDEKTILDEAYLDYGDHLSINECPQINSEEGYYVSWDVPETNIYGDTEIVAKYERYQTTIASDILRNDIQSAILVDGQFTNEDILVADLVDDSSDSMENLIEYWELIIPDDGTDNHLIRYDIPNELDVKQEAISIYYYDNNAWVKTDDIDTMGRYYTFNVPGHNVKLQIVNETKHIDYKKIILYVVIGLFTIACIAGIILLIKRIPLKKAKDMSNND